MSALYSNLSGILSGQPPSVRHGQIWLDVATREMKVFCSHHCTWHRVEDLTMKCADLATAAMVINGINSLLWSYEHIYQAAHTPIDEAA